MNFQRVLEGAGLTKVELALLYGVSRQTIHTWAEGGRPRVGSYTERMASVITAALVRAIDKRVLPLGGIDRPARMAHIASMSKSLQSLKPAPAR